MEKYLKSNLQGHYVLHNFGHNSQNALNKLINYAPQDVFVIDF